MKIGVVTFISDNYGALLQGYALQNILHGLGHDSLIINRGWGRFDASLKVLKKIKYLCQKNSFSEFRKKYLPLSTRIKNTKDLSKISTSFDAIIVGSDQVWNADCIREMGFYYYLDWVPDSVKKITYAVSFGKDSFEASKEVIEKVGSLVRKFSYVGVREDSGVKICDECFGKKALALVDPTLLLNQFDYKKLMPSSKQNSEDYICQFFLDVNEQKKELVSSLESFEKIGKIDNYPPELSFLQKLMRKRRFYSVGQWLKNIQNAKYVITDSYHGMIFSIIFKKQFLVINNKKRGSARFESLLKKINLMDHLVEANVGVEQVLRLLHDPIDYQFVEQILDIEREKASTFLKEACESK
jgi:hypothetical protein